MPTPSIFDEVIKSCDLRIESALTEEEKLRAEAHKQEIIAQHEMNKERALAKFLSQLE